MGCSLLSASAQDAKHPNEALTRWLDVPVPEQWQPSDTFGMPPEAPPIMDIPGGDDKWWATFADPLLDSLINLGVERNYNLAIAMRRMEMARASVKGAQAGWWPSINLDAGWSKSRSSGALGAGKSYEPTPSSYFNAGLSASWEIDIFGKIASGVKAKKASYRASRAEYVGAMLSMAAQIASNYLQLRMLQSQLDVARRHAESQMIIVKIARARFEATLASKLDVAQAWETYYATLATIPTIQNNIHKTVNALAVLVGEYAPELNRALGTPRPMPPCIHIINAGVPMDLLRRRPDIAQAEHELQAYAAQLGIARKDFLPSLTLSGSIGTGAHSFDKLFTDHSFTYSIAPTLSWTLFDGFARRADLVSAREAFQMGIESYNYTVMNAVTETDNALASYYDALRTMEAIRQVIVQNDEALTLAIDRYKNSLSPMSDVITAQVKSLSAENQLMSAQGTALTSLVALYEALGGNYDIR